MVSVNQYLITDKIGCVENKPILITHTHPRTHTHTYTHPRTHTPRHTHIHIVFIVFCLVFYLWHVPSTFAAVNTHANVFFVFLPGGISKEWRQIVSANCDFDREPLTCLCNFYGPFGQVRGDRKNSSRES